MDCEPNMHILTNDVHWKLILINRIHLLHSTIVFWVLLHIILYSCWRRYYSDQDNVPTFRAFSGENRPKKKKTPETKQKTDYHHYYEEMNRVIWWVREYLQEEFHGLRRKTPLRRGHFKTGPKCKGAYRRTGLGCLRHRNQPVHGLSLVKLGEREEKLHWLVRKDQNKSWKSRDFYSNFNWKACKGF